MSSSDTILFVAAIAGAAALFATKPSETDIEKRISELISEDIRKTKADDVVTGVMKLACTSYSNECVKLIRSTMNVTIKDKFLWQSVKITQGQNSLNCLGILNKLYCPGFLNDSKKNDSKSLSSDSSDTSDSYYVSCLINNLNNKVIYKYRWENETNWTSNEIDTGNAYWHGSKKNQKLYVNFDNSYSEGYQEKEYYLDVYSTTEKCNGGKKYEFFIDGSNIDMKYLN